MANSPCRVLLPRALRAEDRFVQLLQSTPENNSVHFELMCWPVMAIEPLDTSIASKARALEVLCGADFVIFVSAVAVEQALNVVDPALLATKQVFAVGRATAECLATAGVQAKTSEQANSEGLLTLFDEMSLKGSTVVICRGRGGRGALKDGLTGQGAKVVYLDLYARVLERGWQEQICQAISQQQVDAIVIHSGEVFHNLLSLLTDEARQALSSIPMLAAGDRIATIIEEQGYSASMVSKTALPEDMVAELVRWYTRT